MLGVFSWLGLHLSRRVGHITEIKEKKETYLAYFLGCGGFSNRAFKPKRRVRTIDRKNRKGRPQPRQPLVEPPLPCMCPRAKKKGGTFGITRRRLGRLPATQRSVGFARKTKRVVPRARRGRRGKGGHGFRMNTATHVRCTVTCTTRGQGLCEGTYSQQKRGKGRKAGLERGSTGTQRITKSKARRTAEWHGEPQRSGGRGQRQKGAPACPPTAPLPFLHSPPYIARSQNKPTRSTQKP